MESGARRAGEGPSRERPRILHDMPTPVTPEVVSATSFLRQVNSQATLRALRLAEEPLRLTDLHEVTGLSRPTLSTVLDSLVSLGWVSETPAPASNGARGRPARLFAFNEDFGAVAGVDVDLHSVTVRIANLGLNTLAEVTFEPESVDSLDAHWLHRILGAATAKAGIDLSALLAVTLSVPGVVGPDGGISRSVVLPSWQESSIGADLARLLAARVAVENDANLAALSEGLHRPDLKNVIVVLVRRRASAGIILNGRLHRGSNGAAGEIGALEEVGWSKIDTPLAGIAALPDKERRLRIQEVAREFNSGLAALVLSFDPDAVVVTGIPEEIGIALSENLETEIAPRVLTPTAVLPGLSGPDSVLDGAVRNALELADATVFTA
ncbi:ROK family transcriptional regulator [Haematomicrobium sanguinis]|uniref:ROK family transcriptional regulator n=1 Tax=Haematomicrobium sanguinis TaxID=479106 RepID=UPI00068DC8B2|nr:ROK family transcriptional regulator [Haematomicrobium sanguinis]